jgi:methylmalonyl-CoA mutase
MIRNDLQHIQLDSQKSKQEPALHEQEASTAAFSRLKALNSSLPILKKILKISITLILVLAFLLFTGPYTTMYVRRPGPFVNMLDFQQPKKVMLLST